MRRAYIALAACILIILMGCSRPTKQTEGPVFYPEPPELPRIQYLTKFTSSKDVVEEQSLFSEFVIGEELQKRLDKPYGVAIHNGKIYVCDINATVVVIDLEKKTFGPMKGATGLGKLIQPININIDRDGNKYVTDPIRGQVVRYDRNDLYVRTYGMPGAWKPLDAVPYGEMLYVADIRNAEVKVFDLASGEIVKRIGNKGEPTEILNLPVNIAFDRNGTLYVSDAGQFKVMKYDRDGHFKGSVGKLGDNFGHFARPKGIALDRQDRLFAVDAAFNVVQIFNDQGRLLLFFGGKGAGPGNLILPSKVTIDYDNVKYFQKYASPDFDIDYLIIVTSQFGDRMVNVYGYGRERGKKYPSEEEIIKLLEERKQKFLKTQETPEPEKEESVTPQGDRKSEEQTGKPAEVGKEK